MDCHIPPYWGVHPSHTYFHLFSIPLLATVFTEDAVIRKLILVLAAQDVQNHPDVRGQMQASSYAHPEKWNTCFQPKTPTAWVDEGRETTTAILATTPPSGGMRTP